MSQPNGATKLALRPRRASRAPSRLGDENGVSSSTFPAGVTGGKVLAKTAVSTSAIPTAVIGGKNVIVGKNVGGLGGAGARRAFGADVSNADRPISSTTTVSVPVQKPTRRPLSSHSQSNAQAQAPSSTGTGLGRLKIHPQPPTTRPVGLGISDAGVDQARGGEWAHPHPHGHKRVHDVDIEVPPTSEGGEYEAEEVDESDDDEDQEEDEGMAHKIRVLSPSHLKKSEDGRAGEEEELVDPEDWLPLVGEDDIVLQQVKEEFDEELDYWDTTMVAEYSEEIFAYMAVLEEKAMPNPRYMDHQTEIEWSMRTTLIDWLLQVHMRYHMLPETLWIAVNIIDRFLSNRVVSLVKFQLVGVTAMFVAAKYEEIMAPSVEEFVYMTEGGYTRDEILKGERIILSSLEFNISPYCTPYSWARRISKADDYDIQTRTLCKFLMEVTLLDHRFLRAKPSMIAAVGMFLARKMLGGEWNESFIYYSNFTEAQLMVPTNFLLEVLGETDFDQRFVYKKYSNKKFLKASIFARNWTLANCTENGEPTTPSS